MEEMEVLEGAEEFTLENVKEAINGLQENFPPDKRTPDIKKLLDDLYRIERELTSKGSQNTEEAGQNNPNGNKNGITA